MIDDPWNEADGFALAPGPRPSPRSRPDADWAMINLDTDMAPPDFFLPLAARPAPPGTTLAYGGYQADQPRVLQADFSCRVVGYGGDASRSSVMMLHSCTGTSGASGGPLLWQQPDGRWVVVAIGSLARSANSGGLAVPTFSVGREIMMRTQAIQQ
jgi:protease YdgD